MRCGNLFGPGDFNFRRIVPETIIRALQNKRLIIRSSGKLIRDYLYIDDAVEAYILILKQLSKKKSKNLLTYNVGSKFNLTVIQLVKLILKIMNKDNLQPKILNYSKSEIKVQKLNFNKIKKDLNWSQKISMEVGINKTVSWYLKNFRYINNLLK